MTKSEKRASWVLIDGNGSAISVSYDRTTKAEFIRSTKSLQMPVGKTLDELWRPDWRVIENDGTY